MSREATTPDEYKNTRQMLHLVSKKAELLEPILLAKIKKLEAYRSKDIDKEALEEFKTFRHRRELWEHYDSEQSHLEAVVERMEQSKIDLPKLTDEQLDKANEQALEDFKWCLANTTDFEDGYQNSEDELREELLEHLKHQADPPIAHQTAPDWEL
ncbi:hypothetical protein Ddc_15060 [Ditylenchus destructor]|nr:hypothetical protein Ddc_15060 [Ditylenchus destructor]